MEIIIGIGIALIISGLVGVSRQHRTKQQLTPKQKREVTENIAVVQPIVRDNLEK